MPWRQTGDMPLSDRMLTKRTDAHIRHSASPRQSKALVYTRVMLSNIDGSLYEMFIDNLTRFGMCTYIVRCSLAWKSILMTEYRNDIKRIIRNRSNEMGEKTIWQW